MVGEAYEMRGSEMKTLKRMKNSMDENRQRVRERDRQRSKEGLNFNQRRIQTEKRFPLLRPPFPPSHQFTPSNAV